MSIAHSNPFSIEVLGPSGLATLTFERPTPEQIGIYLPLRASLPATARATVRYRGAGEVDWREAHPLFRLNPAWVASGAPEAVVDAFAGTIFDLQPGGTYEIEAVIRAPEIEETLRGVASTRALPPASGPATVTASPADNLRSVLAGLAPGDVLELADGTYEVASLQLELAGTRDNPIFIRGASRDGVVLHAPSGRVLQVLGASHVVLERMTLRGSGEDSGTAASSRGVVFWNGAFQSHLTFRHLTIEGVDQGIVASGPTESILVYECILRGNNRWEEPFIETNATWNDDGVRLPGQGNCVFQSTLTAFGDALAVNNGTFSAAVYFYRNLIGMTGDDACEGDYGTRNLGFYDNHVSNCSTLLSLDPLWGGPLYCFRNVCVNTVRGPFKLNDMNSGFAIYSNTIVRTEGTTGWGWVQFNNGALRNWSFRNNILCFLGDTGRLLAVESDGNDPIDFTHNAFYPDGSVWWSRTGGSYGSLSAAAAGVRATTPVFGVATARHEHDVLLEAAPFADAIPLGASHLDEITTIYVPRLGPGSVARGNGVSIPNVTDGHVGDAPDIGAIIAGRGLPAWGAGS